MTSLVIVESPGKIKTLEKYFDKIQNGEFVVKASVGHIWEMTKQGLGFNTTTFKAEYEVIPGKERALNEIAQIARKAEHIYIASDRDREGEAIAAHIQQHFKIQNPKRITFNEITETALREALKNVGVIDQNLVDAQETRRILDRDIGWNVSKPIRDYILPKGSMGRVQTVALLLLVLRERAILTFIPVDYFKVVLNFEGGWKANWQPKSWFEKGQIHWQDKPSAEQVSKVQDVTVKSVEKGTAERLPDPPFITSSLQRAALKQLKLNPKKTMEIAQSLYESGYITYMRTDSTMISDDAYNQIVDIGLNEDLEIIAPKRIWNNKGSAQEAHEAIRPSDFSKKEIDGSSDEKALYRMIYIRAFASQMVAAEYDTIKAVLTKNMVVTINGVQTEKVAVFESAGRKLTKKGWLELPQRMAVSIESEESDESEEEEFSNPIPILVNGQILPVQKGVCTAQKTSPPPRYTQPTLIKKLEDEGLGRPSTYANLMETLLARQYAQMFEKSKLQPTSNGMKLIDETEHNFGFIDVKYTANMEEQLDQIAKGEADWFPIVKSFHQEIAAEVKIFTENLVDRLPKEECVHCHDRKMIKRQAEQKDGIRIYWKCLACEQTANNDNGMPAKPNTKTLSAIPCCVCNAQLYKIEGSYEGKPFVKWQCSDDTCKVLFKDKSGQPDFALYELENKYQCPVCKHHHLKPREGQYGPYWSCGGYKASVKPCSAVLRDLDGAPDFKAFEMDQTHKCPTCKSVFLNFKPAREGKPAYWACSNAKAKTKPCATYLQDLDGKPDFEKFEANNKYKCPTCNKCYLRLYPANEKRGPLWACTTPRDAKVPCLTFLKDLNGEPDFDKYQEDNRHKCVICEKGSVQVRDKTDGSGKFAVCSNKPCNEFYEVLPDGNPDLASKKAQMGNLCPVCNKADLKRGRKKNGDFFWICRDSDKARNACKTFVDDLDGKPDYDNFKPKNPA